MLPVNRRCLDESYLTQHERPAAGDWQFIAEGPSQRVAVVDTNFEVAERHCGAEGLDDQRRARETPDRAVPARPARGSRRRRRAT